MYPFFPAPSTFLLVTGSHISALIQTQLHPIFKNQHIILLLPLCVFECKQFVFLIPWKFTSHPLLPLNSTFESSRSLPQPGLFLTSQHTPRFPWCCQSASSSCLFAEAFPTFHCLVTLQSTKGSLHPSCFPTYSPSKVLYIPSGKMTVQSTSLI